MGLKVYDLPSGGLKDGAIATPSNDITFTWEYDQEELDKTEPLPKDIQIIKKTEPDASEDEVIILAKQKRYRKNKTQEFRKQYNEYEKDGRLNELPLDNIFNPKFKPETKKYALLFFSSATLPTTVGLLSKSFLLYGTS